MVRPQEAELQFCGYKLFIARHANQPICRLWTEVPRHYSLALCSTWLSCIWCSCGWQFVFLIASGCPVLPLRKAWESGAGISWFLCPVLSDTHKLIWLCQADNKCCKGPEDWESWRVNLCHLPWSPGRRLHDWSPHRALGGLSSEIKNKRFPKKH